VITGYEMPFPRHLCSMKIKAANHEGIPVGAIPE
jgi:hypothetical protein